MLTVRWMIKRDIEDILKIENHCFAYPWNIKDFSKILSKSECVGHVVEQKEKIIGYYVDAVAKSKLEILNLAVHPDFRRMGVGTLMVDNIKSRLSRLRFKYVSCNIREYNLDAQLFFKKNKFKYIKTFKNFYEETNEDSYLMSYRRERETIEV